VNTNFAPLWKLICFIFLPIFGGLRVLPIFLILIFVYPGFVLTFLEIPSKDQVKVVEGEFLDRTKSYSRTGHHYTSVRDMDGAVHTCVCSIENGNGNCLSQNYVKDKEVSRSLSGQHVRLTLFPSGSFFGGGNLCYEIAAADKLWLSFSQSVNKYQSEKKSLVVYAFRISIILFAAFILVRVIQFFRTNYSK
jgi:hypothetical protein